MSKRFFFFTFLSILISSAIPALAAYEIQATIPGTAIRASSTVSIISYIQNLWIFGISIGGILALVAIVYGAIEWTVSAGNESLKSDAKNRITQAILGLVLLMSAYLILSFVNPDLVNLANVEKVLLGNEIIPDLEAAKPTSLTDPESEFLFSGAFDTCLNCVPIASEIELKKELYDRCESLEAPFNGQCYVNSSLNDKLVQLLGDTALLNKDQNTQNEYVYIWRITEAYPPFSQHKSQCHNKFGTCVDISLHPPFSNCGNVAILEQTIKNVGLKVLNEYPDCAGGTTTEFSTGGHLHVYLP